MGKKVWVCGDTHGMIDIAKVWYWIATEELTKDDIIIVAGDFGFIWGHKFKLALTQAFEKFKGEVCFVDGNHENFDILETLPIENRYGGKVRKVKDRVYNLLRGEVYTIEDKKIFTFGGGASCDKWRRTEFVSWWSQELPNKKEYDNGLKNLELHNNEIDFVITHSCPSFIFEELAKVYSMSHKIVDEELPLRTYLEVISSNNKFTEWYFGHFHIDHSFKEKYHGVYNNPPKRII